MVALNFLIVVCVYFWPCWIFTAGLFSSCGEQGPSSVWIWCSGSPLRRLLLLGPPGSAVVAHGLRCMWDLPGSGLEPISPAQAGGFFTTERQGSHTSFVVALKDWLYSLCCTYVRVVYFIPNSLFIFIPCLTSPSPVRAGNHWLVLFTCVSASFKLYSLLCCLFIIY